MPRVPVAVFVLVPAIFSMLSACTRVVVVDTPMDALPGSTLASPQADEDWWHIDFIMQWDREGPPDTFLDALIADQICAPALASVGGSIRLWRFHRRFPRDDIGHRLSLRVFTDEESARRVFEHVRGSTVLAWLETDDWVESVKLTRRERSEAPSIAASSDPQWPAAIQSSWPWFIMGVSQAWLALIKQVSVEDPYDGTSKWSLLSHYQSVDETIDEQWRAYGQHAYLHHLNAIFAYEPLVVRGNILMSF